RCRVGRGRFAVLSARARVQPPCRRRPVHRVGPSFPGGITILKRQLGEVEGSFDYVVFNHSFEHMEAPLEVLKHVRSLIAPGGRLIISTPIAATFAWREYGVDWVQLDAPRHPFIPSVEGLKILAGQAGLHVTDVFNSTEFQFWGSE